MKSRIIPFIFCSIMLSAQAQRKALAGGVLIDGYGGPPVHNSVILIDGERIQAVGRRSGDEAWGAV